MHYVKASSVNKELNGPQKGRRKWVGQLAEREREELWERVRLKRFTTKLWRKLNV